MKQEKLLLLGFFIFCMTGCFEHGHSHDDNSHTDTSHTDKPQDEKSENHEQKNTTQLIKIFGENL